MKAIIPAAGLGTRFLPYTKSQPKEMLPVVDKPAIQYVVEEAAKAGIEDILIVTGRTKRAIEDHFDRNPDLERVLESRGRRKELNLVRRIDNLAHIVYVRQKESKGLGDAILCAERFVEDEPFAVLLGDDICVSERPCVRQLMTVHEHLGGAVVALQRVSKERVANYGIVTGRSLGDGMVSVQRIVEKPQPSQVSSRLATIGRYVLPSSVFDILRETSLDRYGEVQLTPAIDQLLSQEPVHGLLFRGKRYDVGDWNDWLRANIDLGRARRRS